MGVFDSAADTPDQLRQEGQLITLRFVRTGSTTGKLTWNIPPPAFGCAPDIDGVYCGIVLTVDTHSHTSYEQAPKDREIYQADPTVDPDLHSGDKIHGSLVIGAFYKDRTTVELVVTGLKEDTPYYFNGFAVDCQYRYHFEGVHAYSLDVVTGEATPDTPAVQVIDLEPNVVGSDGTGLVPGFIYDFRITVDCAILSELCDGVVTVNCKEKVIQIDGIDAQTFDELLEQINLKIKQLTPAVTSPVAPNTGAYYWNGSQLFQWNGTTHVLVAVIIESADPSVLSPGEYWYDPSTDTLSIFTPGLTWNVISNPFRVDYHKDPSLPDCDDYWLNLPNAYVWNGDVWCQLNLFVQTEDPSITVCPACGTYWFDTANEKLFVWHRKNKNWVATAAIFWPDDPNALLDGSLWFDTTNNKLFERITNAWFDTPVTISETEPTTPTVDQYWFKASTEELFKRDATNEIWVPTNVLIWPDDPTDRESCDLWWDSGDNFLYVWDPLISAWNLVDLFLQQPDDPSLGPTLTTNDAWYSPDTEKLLVWNGSSWVEKLHAIKLTPPTTVLLDDVWHDTANNKWYFRDIGGMWIEFNPIESISDPQMLPIGTLWFDTTNNGLFQWNGVLWVAIGFSTVKLTPTKGTFWFDSSTNELFVWNGFAWVVAIALASFSINRNGDICITTGSVGSGASLFVQDGLITPLFDALTQAVIFGAPVQGQDGVSNVPRAQQIGVGTDGTGDERKELANVIRHLLGYPVVQVELTPFHYNIAIDNALQSLRKRSSIAVKRAFFFLDIEPGQSSYILSDKSKQWNKIVNVMGIYRMTSAFLSTAHGTGVYGQILLQQLYSMGSYDLLSYHLVAQYIEQLEVLFAARIVFQWEEQINRLDIFQTFTAQERVLVEATFDKTEQELLENRYTSTWIQTFSTAEAMEILSKIRGKYSTLPGAGGGVSFNSADLLAEAQQMKEMVYQQIDDYIVDGPEQMGMWDITIG